MDILHRIFKAKDSKVDNAVTLYDKFLDWLTLIRPDTFNPDEIAYTINKGKAYLHGTDRKGRPCLVGFPKNHVPGECSLANTFQLQYYWMRIFFPRQDKYVFDCLLLL